MYTPTAKHLKAATSSYQAMGRTLRHAGVTKAQTLEAIVYALMEAFVEQGAPAELAAELARVGARQVYERMAGSSGIRIRK